MRKWFSDSSSGFSLIELLVVISVVLLLSGLTAGGLRAMRSHQVLNQAAARLEMLLELGQGLAMSEGESVYLIIADHDSEPDGVQMRAYTLIKNLSDSEWVHTWQFLPEHVVFARDEDTSAVDLLGQPPLETIESSAWEPVVGALRVLLEMTPEGTFRSGQDADYQSASLLLERGHWSARGLGWEYSPQHEYETKVPYDAVRLQFRPRTGIIQMENKETQP
ncbi:prepilin-type N-terminal cleavage/methylation domain-containing protein [Kiritimatiellaeota bacterium B1221]|nr:prepilin-type N-terminal cleavage/methylation domain-containing protein [Kiritimatiellaeota bacterium B1221]